ncbi:MAG TPA: AAA family ATPase [Jiangellaceae bacterium]|nr:AAA family ATPase [Jiangellaceae bacterium]
MPRLGSGLPLIARTDELDQLHRALRRAQSGTAGAVLVSGDAGVGKSRLTSEFADLAKNEDALVLVGRCLGVGAGLPYLPFVEVVDQLRASHPDVVADRPALAGLTGPEQRAATPADQGGSDLSQLQLFDAMLSALAALCSERVVVLVIEDLHWADPSTRDLLSFLLSRLGSQSLLVVVTYRSDDMHRQHPVRPLLAELVRLPSIERLDLQPFAPADAREFVRALLDGGLDDRLDDALVAAIAERSEGNAFFAEELVAAAAGGNEGLPATLADVLLARVEKLSPETQRVVRAVSVTRRQPSHAALQAFLAIDDDRLEAALREAVQHHVLVQGDAAPDVYAFRHALVREAVYNDLLPGERTRLHAAYAERISAEYDPSLAAALAYHSLHSNDLPTALTASVDAAHESIKIGALGVALGHLEQALELWDAVDDPEQRTGSHELALLRKAAYVASAAGQPERALAFGKAALDLVDQQHGDPVVAADVRRQYAQILLINLRWSEAEQIVLEAWELIKDQPPSKERAWVLEMMARRGKGHPDIGDHRTFAQAAIADAKATGSAGAEANALITLAFSDNWDGRVEQACELLEQARRRAVEAAVPDVELRAIYNLSVTCYEQGLLDLAARAADDGARRAAELGLTWSPYGLELRWFQVMVHYARGDWDRAAAAAAPPGEQVSDTISALIAASGGLVEVGRGQFAAAERMLARVRPALARDDQVAQLAGVAGAEMACWQRRPEAASQLIDEAMDAVRKNSGSEWPMGGIRMATLALAAQADLAQQARQHADARAEAAAVTKGRRYATHAEQTAEYGTPRTGKLGPEGRAWLARMRAERCRLTADHDPAMWQAVVEAFGYGERYQQAIARWRLAEALVATGDRDAASSELSEALETAAQLGAAPLAEACRDLARRARLGLPGAAPPVADTLTPREVSVLRLVAEGRTNRQIGEELFISNKTVSVHVSRVMAKLSAGSRTEAVAIAYQRGLLTR